MERLAKTALFKVCLKWPALGKLQLLEAFRALLLHIADLAGLIFEDLQWADVASLELLRYALPLVPNAKVVVSYRPDEVQVQKLLPEIEETLELAPLSDVIMQQLLQGWLGAPVEAALIEQLIVPAGGNPWFLAEGLKSMLEAQLLIQRKGVFEWTRSSITLPKSIFELLRQRIQHLSSSALEFAQAASVFGDSFEYTDVQVLLEWHDNDCLDALEVLLRAQFIKESKKIDVFVFTHPTFSKALQGKTISQKRRQWHRKAALLCETRVNNPIELAQSFLIGGLPEKAFHHALVGAENFATQYAYPQAETAYRLTWEAYELLEPDGKVEARLRHGLAQTLYALGHVTQAITHWHLALEINHSESQNQIRLSLASALSLQGNGRDALAILEPLNSPEAELEKANCYQRLKENSLAQAHGIVALRYFRQQQNPSGQSRALSILAWIMHNQGFFKRGLWLAERAEKLASQNPYLRLLAYRALIANQFDLGDYAKAEVSYQAALDLPATQTQIQHQAWFELGLANLLVMQDRLPQAQTHYQKAYNSASRAEAASLQSQSAFSLVLVVHMQNQLVTAQNQMAQLQDPNVRQLWQTRLHLATGKQLEAPPRLEQLPTWAHSLQRVTELEWLLANQNYQAALTLTETPSDEYQWFWNLARVHASWFLGLDTSQALKNLNQPMADAGVAKHLVEAWNTMISRTILSPNQELLAELEELQSSIIGVFARDALLRLNNAWDIG